MRKAAYIFVHNWDALRVPKDLGERSLELLHAQLT